jgi:putative NADPH-quinone reductase
VSGRGAQGARRGPAWPAKEHVVAKILVFVGHPRKASLCGGLAEAYAGAARAAGAEIELLYLGELVFDPILRGGYKEPTPLEPDLVAAQAAITRADRLVFVTPVWWASVPALLKGFIDRVFLPGFAFAYKKGGLGLPEQLLRGKTATVLLTMDSPPWYWRWLMRAPGERSFVKGTLEFCGIKPVRRGAFGPVRGSSEAKRAAWLAEAGAIGQRDALAS